MFFEVNQMSKQELMELVAPLSPAERRELREPLDEADPLPSKPIFPLRGTLGVMHQPFEPAVSQSEWEALCQEELHD